MRILFIGDISGPDGLRAVKDNVLKIKQKESIDFVIANAENTSEGRGLTLNDYNKLCEYGIDFFTMGNHTWFHNDYPEVLAKDNIVRPGNIKSPEEYKTTGEWSKIIDINGFKLCISNLIGGSVQSMRFELNNPFNLLEQRVLEVPNDVYHIVDFHAETTSEKNAFFLEFMGKINAVLGTHTHVQTSDNKVVNNTAYITDVGMTGSSLGVIGAKPDTIIQMFKGERKFFRLQPNLGTYQLNAVILDIDEKTNKTNSIERIFIVEEN